MNLHNIVFQDQEWQLEVLLSCFNHLIVYPNVNAKGEITQYSVTISSNGRYVFMHWNRVDGYSYATPPYLMGFAFLCFGYIP